MRRLTIALGQAKRPEMELVAQSHYLSVVTEK
jgi:hypothetical protein